MTTTSATALAVITSAINKSLAVAEMGDRLATLDMGRKQGVLRLFMGGVAGLRLTQYGLGRDLPSYQVAS